MTSLHVSGVYQSDHRFNLENVIIDANKSIFSLVQRRKSNGVPNSAHNPSFSKCEKQTTSSIKEKTLQNVISDLPTSVIDNENKEYGSFPEIAYQDRLRLTSKLKQMSNLHNVDESENETTHTAEVEPKKIVTNSEREYSLQFNGNEQERKTKTCNSEHVVFTDQEEWSNEETILQENRPNTENSKEELEEELLQTKEAKWNGLSEEVTQYESNALVTVQTKELWRRFQEQVEVHRALSEAMREIERISKEISLLETEKETNRVVWSVWRSLQEKPSEEENVMESARLPSDERYKRPFTQAIDNLYNKKLLHKRDSNIYNLAQINNETQSTLQNAVISNRVNSIHSARSLEEDKQKTVNNMLDCQCASKTQLILANAFRPESTPQPYIHTRYYLLRPKTINESKSKENTLLKENAGAPVKEATVVRTAPSVLSGDCIYYNSEYSNDADKDKRQNNNVDDDSNYGDVETNYEDDNDFETLSNSSELLSVNERSINDKEQTVAEDAQQLKESSLLTSVSHISSSVRSHVSSSASEESILESKYGQERSLKEQRQDHLNKHLSRHNLNLNDDDHDEDDDVDTIVTSESVYDVNRNISSESVYDKNDSVDDSSRSEMDECTTNSNSENGRCTDEGTVMDGNCLSVSSATIKQELISSLRAFQSACTAANSLTKALIESSQPLELTQTQSKEINELHASHNTENTHNSPSGVLTRDIRDIQYLNRFLADIQKRVKLLDLHNNAQRIKYRLLKDAQILCKARCELQHIATNRNRTKQVVNTRHKQIAYYKNHNIINKKNNNNYVNENKATKASASAGSFDNSVSNTIDNDQEEMEEEMSLNLLDDAERHRLQTLLNAHLSQSAKNSINNISNNDDDDSIDSINSIIDELDLINETEEEESNNCSTVDSNEIVEEEGIVDNEYWNDDSNKVHNSNISHSTKTRKHLRKSSRTFSNSVEESIDEEIINDNDDEKDEKVGGVPSAHQSISEDVITEDMSLMEEMEEFKVADMSEDMLSFVDEEFAERLVHANSFYSIVESIPAHSLVQQISQSAIPDDSISEENLSNNSYNKSLSSIEIVEDECKSTEPSKIEEVEEEASRTSMKSLHSVESDMSLVNTEHSHESSKSSLQEISREDDKKTNTIVEQKSLEEEEKDMELQNKYANTIKSEKMEEEKQELAITMLNMSAEERAIFEANVINTKQRRQEALHTVNVPSFEYLYNADTKCDETNGNSNQENREVSTNGKEEMANENDNTLNELVHDNESHDGSAYQIKSACVWQGYSGECNVMQRWKDDEINLIHTIAKADSGTVVGAGEVGEKCFYYKDRINATIKANERGCASGDEAEKENVEHWSMLEKLIASKLGSYI